MRRVAFPRQLANFRDADRKCAAENWGHNYKHIPDILKKCSGFSTTIKLRLNNVNKNIERFDTFDISFLFTVNIEGAKLQKLAGL